MKEFLSCLKTWALFAVCGICLLSDLYAQENKNNSSITGKLDHYDSFVSKYVTSRDVDVWLPRDYPKAGKYAVLYMNDGQMLFDGSATWNNQEWGIDEALDSLIQKDKVIPTIVVGVSNAGAGRHGDYFPEKAFNQIPVKYLKALQKEQTENIDSSRFPFRVNSDAYLKFLVKELKPFIDSVYHTRMEQEYTFIGGASMGGLISMYALCEYPEVFKGAACLSTHWPGASPGENNPIPDAFVTYLKKSLPNPGNNRIYFDFGTETLDAFYEIHQRKIDQVMKERGYTDANWQTKKYKGQDHSETSWRSRLPIPLTFLLGKN